MSKEMWEFNGRDFFWWFLKNILIFAPFVILGMWLSGCSLHYLRGEQHHCRDCELSYYGENCPKCGEDYYIQDKLTNRPVNAVRGDGMIESITNSGVEILGHEDEKMPDGRYRFR